LVALVVVVATSSSAPGRKAPLARPTARPRDPVRTASIPAVEAGLLPWQLPAPISREAVLPARSGDSLLIAGGLEAGGISASGVFRLDVAGGALAQTGSLPSATHDAAAAQAGDEIIVVGGGTAAPSGLVQGLVAAGQGRMLSSLPRSRADASAVSVGGVVYVVGGYDGRSMDGEVLATTNGRKFRSVATLAEPVRYPAVAAMGGKILVFGGLDAAGNPVATIQVVDPRLRKSSVSGRMPIPLSGAVATDLGGVVYLAGGETTTPAGQKPSGRVWAYDRTSGAMLAAGSLLVPVAYAGWGTVAGRTYIVGGETAGGAPTADVQVIEPNPRFGVAGRVGAGSPYLGDKLLIADRGNDRLLLLDATGRIVWTYPSAQAPAPVGGFYFPDDAFFIHHGTAIISNQEENDTIVEIAYPSGRILWSYGHPRQAGSRPGYLNTPDDAYLLRDGDITVADPGNCRVLVITAEKKVRYQIGSPGDCVHSPPATMTSPNGDTPLADGNLLVSEITGSWVDEYTPSGHLVWSVKLPIAYPSDPQQIGPDRYLIADYSSPGGIVEFDRAGRILYRYAPSSGPGTLDHPSLVELLPSGVFMANDDYSDRMVAIDPATGALVWQYGSTGRAGTAAGLLNTPDGFDILAPNGSAPTHEATG
jgi:outer membrane protein assembly factor BamB